MPAGVEIGLGFPVGAELSGAAWVPNLMIVVSKVTVYELCGGDLPSSLRSSCRRRSRSSWRSWYWCG
jgi:hypothetical protein